MVTVSFVIPHMGRESLLIATLDSIANLQKTDYSVSVAVVSKNRDFSQELLAFKQRLNVSFLSVPMETTISDQRNIGARQFDSDLLAFIDADIHLSSNWLIDMHKILLEENNVLVSAMQKAPANATELEKTRTLLTNLATDCEKEFLAGSNLLLRHDTFKQSGGFPSELVTCEDYVFTQRVSQFGKLYFSSIASFIHLGEDKEYWAMARKEIWRGQSNIASLKGREIPLSEYPSLILPPAFTISLIVMFTGLLLANFQISLLGAFGWLFILCLYSMRLWRKSDNRVNLLAIMKFYGLYLPARSIGTLIGALKQIRTGDY